MTFVKIRRLLFQLHMWIGLILGILLALLGLSGSVLVYDDAIAAAANPVPHAGAQGQALALDKIVAIARTAAGVRHAMVTITPPQAAGDPVQVRFGQMSRMGAMPGMAQRQGASDVYLDPVSGAVLLTRPATQPGFLTFAHQLHGNFLMGRAGRRFVGWLGVAMLILGATGLVLWWPRRGQWKYAFLVRRSARGLRFHRELHAMLGIWAFIVFMIVSFSGLVLAWPQTLGGPADGPGLRETPTITPVAGARRIGADAALAIAKVAAPGMQLRSIMLPGRPAQAITISYLSNGAINASLVIDPYRAIVIGRRDPSASVMAWQRPVHQGSLNGIWKFLVFLVGFLPAIFVVTGIVMWWKKRKAHIAMSIPLIEEGAP